MIRRQNVSSLAVLVLGLAMTHCGPPFPFGVGGAGGGGRGGAGAGGAGTGGAGTGGIGGTSGGGAGGAPTGPNTAPGFINLAPPLGAALDRTGTPLTPPPPAGWAWYQIQGAVCRDGTPAGFFVKYTSADKLLFYLEGGGACTSPGFCAYNPANVNQVLSGDGQTALGSVGGAIAGRQQPGTAGIFDSSNAANPYRDWNMIYVPYCTGDVYAGSRPGGSIPGLAAPQQFVGYGNMRAFVSRIVPTFQDSVKRVVLTGASAGSFGAALNFSMVQDAFGSVRVDVIGDSGVPFEDQYMPTCMQQRWRETWNLNAALPPDCSECFRADGGGFLRLADFLIRKHPNSTLGIVSGMQDEIMRLFFSMSKDNCAGYDTADPILNYIAGVLPAEQYTAGLNELRNRYVSSGRFATYYLGGANITFHQHTWRPRFYDASASASGESIAQWTNAFLNGTMKQVGP
jgi:hypothetical protein